MIPETSTDFQSVVGVVHNTANYTDVGVIHD